MASGDNEGVYAGLKPPGDEPTERWTRGRTRRRTGWGPESSLFAGGALYAVVFAAAVVPFATVHPGPRAAVALLAVVVGLGSVLRGDAVPRGAVLPGVLLSLGYGVMAVTLIPVGSATRRALQPGLADRVDAGLALAQSATHPLALDPQSALRAWSFGVAVLVLGLGAAVTLGHAKRARGTMEGLVAIGVAVCGLAWAQLFLHAPSILWWTGVGEGTGQPFFGTFVNPNHGGAMAAALLPLAVALLARARGSRQAVWAFSTAALALGVVSSGSRGAIFEAVGGLAVLGLVVGRRRARLAIAGVFGALAVGTLAIGPETVLGAITRALDPHWYSGADLATNRPAIWRDALSLIRSSPWIGVGPGGFADGYDVVKSTPTFARVAHAHDEWLELVAEGGFGVALLWVGALVAVIAPAVTRAVRTRDPALRHELGGFLGAAAALLVAATVDFPVRIGALAVLAAIVGGALVGLAGLGRPRFTGRRRAALLTLGAGGGTAALGMLAAAAALVGTTGAWGDAKARVSEGDVAARDGRAADADHAWRAALAARPLATEAILRLADAAAGEGRYDAARGIVTVATRVDPTLPFAWLDLARLEMRRGDRDAALAAYRSLLALDAPYDDHVKPWLREALKAALAEGAGTVDDVLPDRADRRCAAAAMLTHMKRHPEAWDVADELFQRVVTDDPSCAPEYAVRLHQKGQDDEALSVLATAPDGCDRRHQTGEILLSEGDPKAALPELETALRMCGSKDVGVRFALARARIATGDKSGLGILTELVHDHPDLWDARRALAGELLERGRIGDAATQLEALVDAGVARDDEKEELVRLVAAGADPGSSN